MAKSSYIEYRMFPKLKQNLGGHKFKDDGDVSTVVITQDIASKGKRKVRPTI